MNQLTAENEINAALAIGAGTVLLLALVSGFVKNRLAISEPILCVLIGIGIGLIGFDYIESLSRG